MPGAPQTLTTFRSCYWNITLSVPCRTRRPPLLELRTHLSSGTPPMIGSGIPRERLLKKIYCWLFRRQIAGTTRSFLSWCSSSPNRTSCALASRERVRKKRANAPLTHVGSTNLKKYCSSCIKSCDRLLNARVISRSSGVNSFVFSAGSYAEFVTCSSFDDTGTTTNTKLSHLHVSISILDKNWSLFHFPLAWLPTFLRNFTKKQ